MHWKSELAEIGRGVLPDAETLETAEISQLESQLYALLGETRRT